MPLYLNQQIKPEVFIALWNIQEHSSELLKLFKMNSREKVIYDRFLNEPRKKQWLAYRALLAELLNTSKIEIQYDSQGKPSLAGSKQHLSVTHSGDFAAVILSPSFNVGIDIEKVASRIIKVKDKFLNERELKYINNQTPLEALYVYWGAKESLYKLYGKKNLDFRENILLEKVKIEKSGNFKGHITKSDKTYTFELRYRLINDYVLVFAMDTLKNF